MQCPHLYCSDLFSAFSPAPTTGDDTEGLQEFEFGMSGLLDAEYLRQEFQPFKMSEGFALNLNFRSLKCLMTGR